MRHLGYQVSRCQCCRVLTNFDQQAFVRTGEGFGRRRKFFAFAIHKEKGATTDTLQSQSSSLDRRIEEQTQVHIDSSEAAKSTLRKLLRGFCWN